MRNHVVQLASSTDFCIEILVTMRIHISEVHEVKKPLKCGVCDQSFSKMGNLTTHTPSVDNGTKSLKCDICDQIFP